MVGHAEAICQMLFGRVVGFVSQSVLPRKHQDFKWVLASYVGSIWSQMQGSKARLAWSQEHPRPLFAHVEICHNVTVGGYA